MLIIRRSKLYYTASGIITLSTKVAFIQLLKLCGVHLLYINCPIYRKCNLTVVKTCLLCRWPSGAQVERILSQHVHWTATYRCDDTRCCIIQFSPPDDEHIVLETCRGIIIILTIIIRNLSNVRSKASSKKIPPHSAI